jgi:hypothetical protein
VLDVTSSFRKYRNIVALVNLGVLFTVGASSIHAWPLRRKGSVLNGVVGLETCADKVPLTFAHAGYLWSC